MIKKMTAGFEILMRNYTPDAFVYALLLTLLVMILGFFCTDSTMLDLANYWGQGFWALSTFTLQMAMILLMGYVVALSAPVKKTLILMATLPKTLPQAAIFTTLIGIIGALFNWGFGLIISALYCKEVGRRFKGKKFATLVACSYSGFLVWHGGISGSVPLLVSTPGNFCEALLGRIVPLSETIFAPLNISIVAVHSIALPLLSYWLVKSAPDRGEHEIVDDVYIPSVTEINTPADALEKNWLLSFIVVAIVGLYCVSLIMKNNFVVDLNLINLLLFTIAMLMHKTPRAFLDACSTAVQKIGPILVQFPFYAGIMTVMQESGLAAVISNQFVALATPQTLPLFVYLSAGLVNIFIPSGGGQWAVQGPMVIDAARELGANINATMMAVAWGDSWTNMIQPFWALPLLAIAGLKAKDIMGSLVYVFLVSGLLTAICFVVLV